MEKYKYYLLHYLIDNDSYYRLIKATSKEVAEAIAEEFCSSIPDCDSFNVLATL